MTKMFLKSFLYNLDKEAKKIYFKKVKLPKIEKPEEFHELYEILPPKVETIFDTADNINDFIESMGIEGRKGIREVEIEGIRGLRKGLGKLKFKARV